MTNTLIVNAQKRKGYSIKFHTAISKVSEHIIGFIFMDDTDLGEYDFKLSIDTINDIAERMQRSINQSEGTLKATEGAPT